MPADLAPALAALVARRPDLRLDIRWHHSLPSTMDAVAALGDAGAPDGVVVVADAQTAGRGRRGRRWESPAHAGLYFSRLCRPSCHVGLLTLAAGVAVRDGIVRATGLEPHLKWPNDLLIGSRKVAGLLAEGTGLGTPGMYVTLGVGINVTPVEMPEELAAQAVTLEGAAGRPVDRGDVFAAVLEALADMLTALFTAGADDILRAWREASPSAVGTPVRWVDGAASRHGVTAGVDTSGALLVQSPEGLERIVAGELRWDLPPAFLNVHHHRP